MDRFILYLEDKPLNAYGSLDEAKKAAISHQDKKLKIEFACAPAQAKVWLYDFDGQSWVEQVRS